MTCRSISLAMVWDPLAKVIMGKREVIVREENRGYTQVVGYSDAH